MVGLPFRTYLAVIGALLVACFLALSLSGCSNIASADDSAPFPSDRVATVRITMPQASWEKCLDNPYAQEYVQADFEIDGQKLISVGVRSKGNSSLNQAVAWNSPRMPLAVDFNLFNRARTLNGVKKVFLNNGWSDPTLIREKLAYDIFTEMGMPAPRSCLVDLWVNNNHLGVYTMTEMIDITFLKRHFPNPSGNLYKPDVMSALLDWTEDDLENQRIRRARFQTPEPNAELNVNLGGGRLLDILRALGEENSVASYTPGTPVPKEAGLQYINYRDYVHAMNLKTNLDRPDYSALFRFLQIINKEPDEVYYREIEEVLDVDGTLLFFAISGAILHLDNYNSIGHNTHFYEVNGKFYVIPWDTNMAFGTFNAGIRKNGLINFYVDEPVAGPLNRYPLLNRLLAHPPYMEKYRNYVRQLIEGPFSPSVMEKKIDKLAAMVAPYAARDKHYF
ncbi:MAG TPA: CotH kinase family protein, partial [Dehalococcoidales bacterium]|nr:CotH kinase family protein [Dehalococcoidales bacterium]